MSVDEPDIKETWAQFMRAGVGICPQTAVALHGTLQLRDKGIVKENDVIVGVSTASGVKFTEAGVAYHNGSVGEFRNPCRIVAGSIDAVDAALENW